MIRRVNLSSVEFRNPYQGLFIAVEGIDCCGKSTQAKRISNWMGARHPRNIKGVVATKEPTGGHWGRRIRTILADRDLFCSTDEFDLQEYFARDSREHCQGEIVPELKDGNIVITDRFRASMVYGIEKGNRIELEMFMEMNVSYLNGYFVWPDVTFVFDLSPEQAIERGKKAGRQFDEMEKLETLARVRENYRVFSQMFPGLHFIDASDPRTPEEIFSDLRFTLENLVKIKFPTRG